MWTARSIYTSNRWKTPFTPAQTVQTEYHAVNKTGLYSLALKEWCKKVIVYRNWASFKQVFAEEYHKLVEETKVTRGDAGFQSTDAMQEIGGALEHLAMEAVAEKDIVTKLTEAVKTLTRNNASLTTQLRDAMKTNLDMAKTVNFKAAQAQEPEDKRLTEKARRHSVFERNLVRDG